MTEHDDDRPQLTERNLRILEAILFASSEPLDAGSMLTYLGPGVRVGELLAVLQQRYARRG